jgi:hypothetical protein
MPNHLGGLAAARQALAATTLGLALAVPAHAGANPGTTLIDFNAASLTGLYLPGDSMTAGGYQLTTRVDFGIVDVAAALGLQAPSGNASQFYFASNDGQLEITRGDNIPFQLNSFSAAFVPQDPPSAQMTGIVAIGQLSGGGTSTYWWAFPPGAAGINLFSSYALPADFTNLVSLTFRACAVVGGIDCSVPTLNNGQFAIDDIVLTPVPEPAPAALLTLGAALLALRLRRARTAA